MAASLQYRRTHNKNVQYPVSATVIAIVTATITLARTASVATTIAGLTFTPYGAGNGAPTIRTPLIGVAIVNTRGRTIFAVNHIRATQTAHQ